MIQVKKQSGRARLAAFILAGAVAAASAGGDGKEMQNTLAGKKVLIIVAADKFQDEEFGQPYNLLTKSGATVKIACSRLGPARGMFGRQVTPDCLLDTCKAAEFDAILFIGGQGAAEYFNSAQAHRIAREAAAGGKVLGAICIAPATLANAGVLQGKKATVFPSEEQQLSAGGAILVRRGVVADGRIVTAVGPQAAKEFAATVAALMQQ